MNNVLPIVTVIVPAFNVESYLEKCIISIINQTYEKLEIILVDDGSPDRCGAIIDDYARVDFRITAIHQKNGGLSSARNSGIKIAHGKYIAFIDGDDWIEPNMIQELVDVAERYNSDVCCFGHFRDNKSESVRVPLVTSETFYHNEEVMLAHYRGRFHVYTWNKLWRMELFSPENCFPEGSVYEDIASNWKRFLNCQSVVCVPETYYHYMQNPNSISHTQSMKNISDRWHAFKNQFEYFESDEGEIRDICIINCLTQASYTWRWLYQVPANERTIYAKDIQEMNDFAKRYKSYIHKSHCSTANKIGIFFAAHPGSVSMCMSYKLNQLYRKATGRI